MIETTMETVQTSATMPKKVTERSLLAQARAAAKAFPKPDEPLRWTGALEIAPWPAWGTPALEREFRATFAEGLAKRGAAVRPQRRTPPEDSERTGRSAPRVRSVKVEMRRLVSGTKESFAKQDARAAAANLSWSAWAARRLDSDE